MPDLLLELRCEEIPARMQARAAEDLKQMVTDRLVDAGLVYEGAIAHVTPRRLALSINGIPSQSQSTVEERKGPRVGAPEKALAGFLKAAGLTSIEDAEIASDPKKGDFYKAVIKKEGSPAQEIISGAVIETIHKFPWPKSMRWGASSRQPGALKWVRPLRGITCNLVNDAGETSAVEIAVDTIQSTNETDGHRFLAATSFKVSGFDDYATGLEKAKVVLDRERRKSIIETDAETLAFAQNLEVVSDPGLLEEVCGLVEWPVVLMGTFDEAFLAIPDEVIRASIRTHQKCFVVRDPKTQKLANKFILTANTEAKDGGEAIIAGNERVIRARLADAEFFWNTDRKTALDDFLPQLENVTFHAKLGTQAERIERIRQTAANLLSATGASAEDADRAALLCKADLVTEMVGEFPELQGLMGRYYASSEKADVASALEEHYKPQGPKDSLPTNPVSLTIALADKLDMLMSFWSIDEKPTGSKDPFALRRAALGIIRILLDSGSDLSLGEIFRQRLDDETSADLLTFFADRLKVHLREEGARHDLIDAVFALPGSDNLVVLQKRLSALAGFLASDDGVNLLAGYRRAVNILRVEEKKDGAKASAEIDFSLLNEPQEKDLASAVDAASQETAEAISREDFAAAMSALAKLRAPVDAFFDAILVNDEAPQIRQNRLAILAKMRNAALSVADLSKVSG